MFLNYLGLVEGFLAGSAKESLKDEEGEDGDDDDGEGDFDGWGVNAEQDGVEEDDGGEEGSEVDEE